MLLAEDYSSEKLYPMVLFHCMPPVGLLTSYNLVISHPNYNPSVCVCAWWWYMYGICEVFGSKLSEPQSFLSLVWSRAASGSWHCQGGAKIAQIAGQKRGSNSQVMYKRQNASNKYVHIYIYLCTYIYIYLSLSPYYTYRIH